MLAPRRLTLAAAVLLLAGSAGGGGGQRLDDTVTVSATVETPNEAPTEASSGRVFAIGTHADQDRGTLTFDRVDWFTGKAVVAACRADRVAVTPTAWCNDFYYRNSEPVQETIKVTDAAEVTLADYDASGRTVPQIPATLKDLDERFTGSPTIVVLTIEHGVVAGLHEQFIP